jgi:hypothetical protein
MQLGKSFIGALIGAAIGIGLLLVVFRVFHWDKVWLAIPFALITGLGVRTLVGTSGHASYARGALTMLVALAAYIGGWMLVAKMATAQANTAGKPAIAANADAENAIDDKSATADSAAPKAPDSPPMAGTMGDGSRNRMVAPTQQSTWDLIWLAIAALVAYEMGRGTTAAPIATTTEPAQPLPAGTHPDA